jgi:ABC-type Fe3+ transport system permease subunit
MMRRLLLGGVAAFLMAMVVVPLVLLVLGLQDVSQLQKEGDAIANTILLAGGSALTAFLFGLPVGLVAARRRLPPLLESAMILPYAVPPYVTTVAWIVLANPTNGVLTRWLPINAAQYRRISARHDPAIGIQLLEVVLPIKAVPGGDGGKTCTR